jgi:hypothetical protein
MLVLSIAPWINFDTTGCILKNPEECHMIQTDNVKLEELSDKLIGFFNFNGLTLRQVDKVLEEAREKVKKKIIERLTVLFDSQMETLQKRNCPEAIVQKLLEKKDKMLTMSAEMEGVQEHNIPFVPVIPRSYLGIYGLMSMINDDKKHHPHLIEPKDLTDSVNTPDEPYFIFNVSEGKDTTSKSPEEGEKMVKDQNRSCLTIDEGIALCVHSNVLSRYYVFCSGSRYVLSGKVPIVCLDRELPKVYWCGLGEPNSGSGTASCSERA